jgi:hypothetical protein
MKIQTQSDYIIQKYNPTIIKDKVARGFNITIESMENNKIKIKIEVNTNNIFDGSGAKQLTKQCAFYIVYGEDCSF